MWTKCASQPSDGSRTFKIIACEIALREICWLTAQTPNVISVEFLNQGYHGNPELGREHIRRLMAEIRPGQFDAILLGYGICNHLTTGLVAEHTPIVIPRAHDCLTWFFGSKERYRQYFDQNHGVYYYTSGWLEYERRGAEEVPLTNRSGIGPLMSYEELLEKYGEDNADYLEEFFNQWKSAYHQGTLIQMDLTRHLPLKQQVQAICDENHWSYGEVDGDMNLLKRWVNGDWNDDFLIVPPGYQVAPSYEDNVLKAVPANEEVPVPKVDVRSREQQ